MFFYSYKICLCYTLLELMKKISGFTLIEVLLVIAIIAILASIVIIAINPARQIAQANNAQRAANVTTILNAIGQYAIDNRGAYPAGLSSTPKVICSSGVATSSGCTDLSPLTSGQLYLSSLPYDPFSPNTTSTWYVVSMSTTTNPRITVSAPFAELGNTISVTR
jgi:prepilin-type N-terminal cleavage/methylation domain-containing protein